jgi:hypothetical protein
MDFHKIIKKITQSPKQLSINKALKTIKGMTRFTSKNAYGDEYIKVNFTDTSALLLIIPTKEIFYSPRPLGILKSVNDQEIGTIQQIEHKNIHFKLANKNDYQYCLQHYIGIAGTDIEGECLFSDYLSEDGNHMLSLGWLSQTGKRADVYAYKISHQSVSL